MKRVLLKLSGEALSGATGEIYDNAFVDRVAEALAKAVKGGKEIAVVVGAGNIWRGRQGGEMDRTSADRMGMLATVINSICLKDAIERAGVSAAVMTAVPMPAFGETFTKEAAVRHLNEGRVVIFGAGSGNPYFTTDTAAALRGTELKCDAIIKATKVDGVYDKDPMKFSDAVRFDELSYDETLRRHLKVMDATAITLAQENNIPVIVCSMLDGAIKKVVCGEPAGTTVKGE